ncbi:hypothetical protein [Bacillus altitudinis]|nr:hypothetical protein [Bacillus altitudinis]
MHNWRKLFLTIEGACCICRMQSPVQFDKVVKKTEKMKKVNHG